MGCLFCDVQRSVNHRLCCCHCTWTCVIYKLEFSCESVQEIYSRCLQLFQDIYCKYKVYLEDKFTQTKSIANTTNPDYNHERVISLKGTPEVRLSPFDLNCF